MEKKDFKFTLDDMDEEKGVFTGYASIWGVLDAYGDIVDRGAFKKTLQEQERFPMLWSHDILNPIGIITAKEDRKGLNVNGHLNLDVQRGREVRSLMKQGAIKGLSIGYKTIKTLPDENGEATRRLKEIKLYEVSPVVFPACEPAQVDAIKTDDLELIELKPYPNEHSCRLQSPDKFSEFRRGTRKHNGKEYSVIYGKPKEGEGWEEQAYRYAKDSWSAEEARAHCKDHEGSFEAASGKANECESCKLVAILDEIDGLLDQEINEEQKDLIYEIMGLLNVLIERKEPESSTSKPNKSQPEFKPDEIRLIQEATAKIAQIRQILNGGK